MNSKNLHQHNSQQIEGKISFEDFVVQVCEKIGKIISHSPGELDKSKFHESFGVDDLHSPENDEIYHNFLYNIPNIIAYAYKEVGDSIRPIIFSLAKLYQEKTGEQFLGIDWNERKRFPVTKIKEFIQERDLPDEYMYYLFGSVAFNNKFRGKKSEKKDPKYTPAQLIKKSSLYRKLTLNNLDNIEYVETAEYIRKLVTQSFGSMHEIQTVSDEDMLAFLVKKSKEEIEETEHQEQDEDEEADEGEDEMNKKSAAEFLGELEEISSSGVLTGETENLIDQDNITEYSSRIQKCRQVKDKYTESCIEKEIAQHALSITSRYKKNSPENYDTEPQNFQESQRYACFSGTWLLASLLQQYGFEKDRLFFADSFFSSAGGAYKHNYLIYKLANGKYIKIDYGFGSIYETTNFDTEIKNLEYGNPSTYTYMGRVDNDLALHVYRLEDGISLIYLTGLMRKSLEGGDYESILELCNIARAIHPNSYHIYEYEGLALENLGMKLEAKEKYEECLKSNPASPVALFKLGEHYFEGEDYGRSEKLLKKFRSYTKNGWKVSPLYTKKASEYLKKIEARREGSDEKIDHFIETSIGKDGDIKKGFEDQYFNFAPDDRKVIFERLLDSLGGGEEINMTELAAIFIIMNTEKDKKTSLWGEINARLKKLLGNNGQ